MKIVNGITWNCRTRRAKASAVALLMAFAAASPAIRASAGEMTDIVVRARSGRVHQAEQVVRRLNGTPGDRLDIINGFSARVPSGAVAELRRAGAIANVTPDIAMKPLSLLGLGDDDGGLLGIGSDDGLLDTGIASDDGILFGSEDSDSSGSGSSGSASTEPYDPKADPTSMTRILDNVIKADDAWDRGYTGRGVGVALIDTGTVPVNGLTNTGAVVNGPDISFESQFPESQYLDGFGHGTHLAGVLSGKDNGYADPEDALDAGAFVGVAPGAHLVNIRVGDSAGSVDVSQVLAGIQWAVEHRSDPGLNIRVLNLAFGTDSVQPYAIDPLTYAVEAAWRKGIVVVVAAGNSNFGKNTPNSPATDPFIISVGAADTSSGSLSNFTIPEWSARSSVRGPDVVAPGRSIVSLRSPGSYVDEMYPDSRVGDRYTRGSGTSQASAMVSGMAAILLQQRPSMTPDQVKKLLTGTASPIPDQPASTQGAGFTNLTRALNTSTPGTLASTQGHVPAVGTGTLEGARGSVHVVDADGVELTGETDILGEAYGPGWTGSTMTDGSWTGTSWSGKSWSGKSWSGKSWSGKSWSDASWSGKSWSGKSWSGKSWSGKSWSGTTWSGKSWSARSWSGKWA